MNKIYVQVLAILVHFTCLQKYLKTRIGEYCVYPQAGHCDDPPPPPILDDRKSLSIAFLAISDQYASSSFFGFFFTKWLAVLFNIVT